MINKVALQHAMLDADCSARALAKAMGISSSTFYRRFNGQTQFTLGDVDACVSRLARTPEKRDEIFFKTEVS